MMTNRKRIFILEYLKDFNATRAAKAAGYSERTARSQGQRLLTNVDILPVIKAEIAERSMSKDEVLTRLADIARGDMAELMDITTSGFTLQLLIDDGNGNKIVNPKTKLIKKIKQKVTTYLAKSGSDDDREIIETEIELYSAHDALRDLGKVHALFTDNVTITGWRAEVVGLLRSGAINPKDVLDEVDNELAIELFREAGIDVNLDNKNGGN